MNSDVIVVGAGPAGLYSALKAARGGAQVIVCEEHKKVGAPSHCTGHISRAGIRRLNLRLPKNVFENEIKSAVFYSPSGYQFPVRFPGEAEVTCVVNRELFDEHLCELAVKAGARILYNTTAKTLSTRGKSFVGAVVERRRRTEELHSKVVIDAEGVSSRLLKKARLPSLDGRMVVNGVQAQVDRIDNVDDDAVEVFLSRKIAPGFFAWIVPRRDGSAKVGLATERNNPQECLRHFVCHYPITRKKFRRSHLTDATYHPISLGGPMRRTFHHGLMIVGDAASHVKPTTGGGIVLGLTCAKVAGEVAARASKYHDSSADFLSEYERRWKRRIGFDLKAMRLLRLGLNRLSDKKLDQMISLCKLLKLEESLSRIKEVDLQGTSLLRIARSPRFLATALYFLAASFL